MLAENGAECIQKLSPDHQKMLYEESGVSPEVAAERGYYTARTRAEVPEAFKDYQRRPGLVIPTLSPGGERGVRLRPDRPRRDKKGKPIKYEQIGGAKNRLDVLPRNRPRLKDPSIPLWGVEGEKKADALASRGVCVVGVTGVWNFISSGEPVPCFEHIAFKGRTVYICYDSDILTNPSIQAAAARLAGILEALGATVLVVYLPDAPDGSKQGADDFLVAGGTVAELKLLARRYNPADFATVRLSRDERLQAATGELWAAWRAMPARKIGECSERAVMCDLLRAGEKSGKLEADGVRVIRSIRDIAEGAQVSLRGAKNALTRLERAGRIRREMWGRAKDKPGAYVLLTPSGGGSALGKHIGGNTGAEEPAGERGREHKPLSSASYDPGVYLTRAPSDDVPELRWPKVIHTWDWREGKRVVVDSFYVRRLGKRRGEILRYLLEHGTAAVSELVEVFGSKRARPRDFRRRILGPLETEEIISVAGETVELTPAWREALEWVRERDDEIKDARLQAERFKREKQAFRRAAGEHTDPMPETKGREHIRRIREEHRERWASQEAEELRRFVRPAKDFVSDVLGRMDPIRLGLLMDMWGEQGGQRWHLRLALRELRCTMKRHDEYPGELFVYPPKQSPETPAPVQTPAEPEPVPVPKPSADGIIRHGPTCLCEWCADEPVRSYAKIGALA